MRSHSSLSALFVFSMLAVVGCGGGEDSASGAAPPSGSAPSPAPAPTPAPTPAPAPASASATLQWTAPDDSRVQGYRVYYGTGPRDYLQDRGAGLDAAASPIYVVTRLESGQTYYFAVTAYDAAGNESDYSGEVTKVVE